jgi:hypothetical protein
MKTFTDHEMKLIRKLADQPPLSILETRKACLLHSYCSPLPLFRVHKLDDATFEAEWNDYHRPETRQLFKFADVG